MTQLPLPLIPKLPYSAENFLLHQGVRELCSQLITVLQQPRFRIGFVFGAPRTGKTHLSVRLVSELSSLGIFPRMGEGQQFTTWLATLRHETPAKAGELFIIDDAQEFLMRTHPGESGQLVSWIEELRVAKGGVLFLSSKKIEELPCDDHVKSRLIPGSGFVIEAPAEGDIAELIRLMAKQRGLYLTPRRVGFLAHRLGRDIPALEAYFERVRYLAQVLGKNVNLPLLSDAV